MAELFSLDGGAAVSLIMPFRCCTLCPQDHKRVHLTEKIVLKSLFFDIPFRT